jgi:hypothetical protein
VLVVWYHQNWDTLKKGTELITETSEYLHILARLSARENFIGVQFVTHSGVPVRIRQIYTKIICVPSYFVCALEEQKGNMLRRGGGGFPLRRMT